MNNKHIEVLLIEDNPGDTQLIRRMLAEAKSIYFNVQCTDRLSAGSKYLARHRIDVVLLDLSLPDSQGFDTFNKIQTQTAEVPVIVFTGLDDEDIGIKAVRKGAQDYLIKGRVDGDLLARSICYAIERKKAQQILNRYKQIVENIDDALFIKDLKSRYIFVNKKILAMFGNISAEQILGKNDKELMSLRDAMVNINDDQAVFRTGKPKKHIKKNNISGKDYWFLATKVPLKDDNGKIIGLIGIARDITELKHAEEKLQGSFEKLHKILEQTVNALASAVGKRDPYTAGHQERVAQLACAIAEEIELSEEQINGIRLAGLLHDVGKIAVPAEILSKPTKLSEAEFDIVKTHTQVGYEILKDIEFPWPIAEIILQHHERINGSGYPHGLLGKDILLQAKILGVADIIEAMCSHRPYRPAPGLEKAIEELIKNRDVLYDQKIVDVCLKLFKEKEFRFEGIGG